MVVDVFLLVEMFVAENLGIAGNAVFPGIESQYPPDHKGLV